MATIVHKQADAVVTRGNFAIPARDESRRFPDGASLVRAEHIPWTPWAFEGSAFKLLDINRSAGTFFTLIRFETGPMDLPPHHHFADVHAYVLQGDFGYEYGSINTGDYLLEAGGVNHAPNIGPNGATFLVHFMGPLCGVSADGQPEGEVVDCEWMYRAAKANGAADHLPPPH
jgi:2,4'-dihydroxyacetophenone dioxygenase